MNLIKNLFFLTIIIGISISQLIKDVATLFDEPTTVLYARSGMFQVIGIGGLFLIAIVTYITYDNWKKFNLITKVLLVGISVSIFFGAVKIGGQSDRLFAPKGYALCEQVTVRITSENRKAYMIYHKNLEACNDFKKQTGNLTYTEFTATLNAINQRYMW